ncbi:MAG: DUF1841 family protein [Legionellales bacterium]|nr:DUF1841 family protein [Legionellales bacterium]
MYMMNDPSEARQPYFDAWAKFKQQQPLTDLEKQLVQVMLDHPEYHFIFEKPEKYLDGEYLTEEKTNPFMHLAVHLVIRDQVMLDNPKGIRQVFAALSSRFGDPLVAEHEMMSCLSEVLWRVLKKGEQFNESQYMRDLKAI